MVDDCGTQPSDEPRRKAGHLASSLGTVFEWYDFYLYGSLAAIIGAQFFASIRKRRATLRAAGLCRRLPRAAVRRAGVRPVGRSRRPQIHLPRHHRDHGCVDLPGRPAAQLRRRSASPRRSSWSCCACCRAWRSAANMAARRPMSPSTRPHGRRGFLHQLDPDHRDPRPVPVV